MITQECWLTLKQLKSLVRTGEIWADSMDGGGVVLRVQYNESLKRVDELVRSEVEGG